MSSTRLPTVFFGHGSPVIALEQNAVTRRWRDIAETMGRPRAILCISAHWLTRGAWVTADERPRTIHDFSGFAPEMHRIVYAAPGAPALAARVAELLAPEPVGASADWGLDHGCWTVLMKAYPQADIPVVQLSLDIDKSPAEHFALGRRLRPLRDEGVLIMGSGNIVHNLRDVIRRSDAPARGYAANFSQAIQRAVAQDDVKSVINYAAFGEDAERAAPTPDHFWPLLYVLGARHADDSAAFDPSFIEYGSIDMTTVLLDSRAAARAGPDARPRRQTSC